jgi:F0F1-type ATP synthase membrane subunit c/vacuolar-type H+-ATPase subunit K
MEPEQPLVEDQTELPGGKAVEAEAEKPERRSPWTPEVIIQAFKEVVTALLGLAVVIYTLILARNTLALVGQPEKLADAKDVLLLILGLAGVVVGYYFGRVPADARASQAQQQTNEATARAEQVSAQTEILADEVDEVMDRMAPAAVTARGAKSLEGEAIVTGDLQRIRDDLRALSRLSRRR